VHTAVSTVKEVSEFLKTRKLPSDDAVTNAALFGVESAPVVGTETVRPDTEPLTTGSGGSVAGLEGEVGFPPSSPPPQADRRALTATRDAAWQACAQNCRREGSETGCEGTSMTVGSGRVVTSLSLSNDLRSDGNSRACYWPLEFLKKLAQTHSGCSIGLTLPSKKAHHHPPQWTLLSCPRSDHLA
jgi:hypothetical protein